MSRPARTKLLNALTVKRYAEGPLNNKPLHDGGGLYLRRRDGGSYWYLRLTEPGTGKQQWHKLFDEDPLGAYPHKSLAAARDEAERLWSVRRQGLDPRAEKQKQIQATAKANEAAMLEAARTLSVRQLFDRWRLTELQPRLRADGKRLGRKDGGQYVLEQFERHVFPYIGQIPLPDLRKSDLLAILDTQLNAGKARTANVLLADLKQMLDFALERDLIAGNPLASVKKNKVGGANVERDRVLTEEEVKLLAQQIPAARMQPSSQAALWIILATGARIGELMGSVWGQDLPTVPQARKTRLEELQQIAEANGVKLGVVDLLKSQWYLPDTKNQRDHLIHLSPYALAQFTALAELRRPEQGEPGSLSPWVFPASEASGPVCVKSFGKQISDRQKEPEKRMKNRAKASTSLILPGGRWTAHDLRRTAATFMARLGFGNDVINECLNHVQKDRMAKIYIRDRRITEQKEAFHALGELLQALSEHTGPDVPSIS